MRRLCNEPAKRPTASLIAGGWKTSVAFGGPVATTHIRAFEVADPGTFFGTRHSFVDRVHVPVDRETLFAHHAGCPKCGAFVRQLATLHGPRFAVHLVAG